ncbi:hypothetical protein [Pseudomonas laurylsulfatiphila]|uniref:hypothetical protein n=1 Tax=Pseudomonas laurylsulfatiphila TaxID=2011015 RepID=UPI00216099AA|nr:hypothetical protein [Pseudomonas laurylsulfatiphila]UVM07124.1 hypothetical protein LOY25_10655 [Pseudomonas laurylsulfatiphila]
MSASEVLSRASAEGVALVLEGDRLTWTADHQPPVDLLTSIKAHRLEIIAALGATNDTTAEAQAWLDSVARLLECSPGYLLEHGFIDRHDLAEQHRIHPRFIVPLIRSNPTWGQERPDTPAPSAPEQENSRARCVLTAATATPEWCQAYNLYLNHLMLCHACHAPTNRYCVTGSELRQRYDQMPMEPRP